MLKRKVVVDRSGITAGQMQDFWRKADDGTIDGRVFAYMLDNVGQARKEALKGDFVTLVRAREIMGSNFFGPGDAESLFGRDLGLSPESLGTVPFSEEFLRLHSDDSVLVAVPAVSVLDVVGLMKEQSVPVVKGGYSTIENWFADEVFAQRKVKGGWHLVAKDITTGYKACEFKPEAPFRGDDVESAVLLYSAVVHFLATGRGRRLFTNELVGSCDVSSHTCRFAIRFLPEGIMIDSIYEDDCD